MLTLLLILATQIVTPPSGPSLIAPGGNVSAPTDPACEIAGGVDCAMTGPVRLDNGSQTLPSLTLEGDNATGWYRNGTDGYGNALWAWSSGGSRRLQLEAAASGSMTLTMPGIYSSIRSGIAGSGNEPNFGFAGSFGGMWKEGGTELRIGNSGLGQILRWAAPNILLSNVTAFGPDSNDSTDLGRAASSFRTAYIGTSIIGNVTGKPLLVTDADAVHVQLPLGADFYVTTTGAQQNSIVDMSDTEQFRVSSYISTSSAVLSSLPVCSAANEGAQIYVKGTDTYAQKPPPYADLDSDLCICAEYHGTLVWASVLAPQYGCGVGTAP